MNISIKNRFVILGALASLIVIIAIVIFVFTKQSDSSNVLEEDEQLYTIVERDLSKKVTVSGQIEYSDKTTLNSTTKGTVFSTFIDFKRPVKVTQGDILFTLDQVSIAKLESELRRLELELQQAKTNLLNHQTVDWQTKYTKALLAAESAAEDLRIAEQLRNEELDFAPEIIQTQLAIHKLKQELVVANNVLADLDSSVPNKILALEKNEMNAYTQLKQKVEAFTELDNPTSSDKLAELNNQHDLTVLAVDNLKSTIANHISKRETKDQKSLHSDALLTMEESLQEKENWYLDQIYKWFGYKDQSLKNISPTNIYKIWDINLDSLFDKAGRSDDINAFINKNRFGRFTSEIRPFSDDATPWNEEHVLYWLALYPGSIVGTCDLSLSVPQELKCVDKELFDAWESLETFREVFYTFDNSYTENLNNLKYQLEKLEYDRKLAEDNLNVFLSPEIDDLSDANLEMTIAEAEVEAAGLATRQAYENLQLDVDQQNSIILDLKEQLRMVEKDLETYKAGPTPDDIALANSKYSAALAESERAADSLNNIVIFDEYEISKMQSDIKHIELTIIQVKENIENSTFRATKTGILTEFIPKPGTQILIGQKVGIIASDSSYEFTGPVNENDIVDLTTGLEVKLKIDALPDQSFKGDLMYLGFTPLSQDGLVSYKSTISINDSKENLRAGLSAVAEIYLTKLPKQLAVPMDAVITKDGKNYIKVQEDEVIIEKEITVGENDEFWVAVSSGLSIDETIVIKSSSTSSERFEIDWEE
ncbi:MAG: hypothetical protein CL887_04055 [Dehalococcoidia bacterium]|nr:hypothetical protein [Dehalococcoidia bacterium]